MKIMSIARRSLALITVLTLALNSNAINVAAEEAIPANITESTDIGDGSNPENRESVDNTGENGSEAGEENTQAGDSAANPTENITSQNESSDDTKTDAENPDNSSSGIDEPDSENNGESEQDIPESNEISSDSSDTAKDNTDNGENETYNVQEATDDNVPDDIESQKNQVKTAEYGDEEDEYEKQIIEHCKNSKYYSESGTPWLADFEYHIEGNTVFLDRNISFKYGDGIMNIPSGAIIDNERYNVEINLSDDFFCEETKANAKMIFMGNSYDDNLRALENYYYDCYNPMYNDTLAMEYEAAKNIARSILNEGEEENEDRFPPAMAVGSEWGYASSNNGYLVVHGEAEGLFKGCNASLYNLERCNFGSVHSVNGMFSGSGIMTIDEHTMPSLLCDANGMFADCECLINIDNNSRISGDCCYMFARCNSLTTVRLNCSLHNASGMFRECTNLQDVALDGDPYNMSEYVDAFDATDMFAFCSKLEKVSINWYKIGDISEMFYGCENLKAVDFTESNWIVDKIPEYDFFNFSSGLTYKKEGALNIHIFDPKADLYSFGSFKKIIKNIDFPGEPYIFLNGGLFKEKDSDKNYYRGIDTNTPSNARLNADYLATKITFKNEYELNNFRYADTIDILPNYSYECLMDPDNCPEISGFFTDKHYGKKVEIGDNPEDFKNIELVCVKQFPYEIRYNDEMANFFSGVFNRKTYYVSDAKWKELKKKLNKTEYNRLHKKYFNGWKSILFRGSGICYGISAAQVASHAGKLAYNKKIHDLDPGNDTDRELLTLYHLGQETNAFKNVYKKFGKYDNERRLIELVNRALTVREKGPAMLVYNIPGKDGGEHAVVIDGCENTYETINGQRYAYKIKVCNVESGEGMELPNDAIQNRADLGAFDIYVSSDYKYMTNKYSLEFKGQKQPGSAVLAIYDDVDAMNYFGKMYDSGWSSKKDGYNIISVAKGAIKSLDDFWNTFLTKIAQVAGTEADGTYEEYLVDISEENYPDEPIVIMPDEDGIEFTYETQNKAITFKSDTKEPVSVAYDKTTDDYEISATSGSTIELQMVNDEGASYGVSLTGKTAEAGKQIEISSSDDKVYVSSEADIKADINVDEQETKVAAIDAKGICLEDKAENSKFEVALSTNNDQKYDDRVIVVNYSGDTVSSITDNGNSEEKPSDKPESGEGNNNQNENGSKAGDNSGKNDSDKGNKRVDNAEPEVSEFATDDAEFSVTAEGEVKLTKYTDLKKKSITIDSTVAYNGKEYKITAIGSKCFNKCKATKVTLGEEITTIASKAFKGSKVKNLVLKTGNLTKSSVKNSLKSSKVTKVSLKGAAKSNKKDYKKFFTKKNLGKKITLK